MGGLTLSLPPVTSLHIRVNHLGIIKEFFIICEIAGKLGAAAVRCLQKSPEGEEDEEE